MAIQNFFKRAQFLLRIGKAKDELILIEKRELAELEKKRTAELEALKKARAAAAAAAEKEKRLLIEKFNRELKKINKELERRVFELGILREMGERIGYTLDFKRILDIISTSLAKILDYSTASYMLLGPEGTTFNAYLNERVSSNFVKEIKIKMTEALKGLGAEKSAAADTKLEANLFGEIIDEQNRAPVSSFFNVPLIVGEEVIGILNVASTKPDVYKEAEIRVLYTLASQASIAISRLQAIIRSETERTSALVESLSNGLVMFNLEHKILITNPAAKEMLALPEEKLNLFEIARIFEKVGLYDRIEKCLKAGETEAIEEAEARDKIYEIFVSAVKDPEGKIIGGTLVLHDVTHRREIERAKTEFVSVASHQLRTPLSSIGWFAEMLLDEEVGKVNEQQKDYLQQIYDSNRRMTALINDLLNVSRIEAGKIKIEPRLTQLEELIESIITEAKSVAEPQKISIILKKPKTKLPKINIDPARIRQTIQNLISNAVRYNKENGKVTISLEKRKEDILFSCADTGIGIPKDEQEKVFAKFFRSAEATKKQAEGTGLGLYIAKSIVESSGGKMWFESKEGKGTTFYFTLPLTPLEISGAKKVHKANKSLTGLTKTKK